jgi:hypothetical protein
MSTSQEECPILDGPPRQSLKIGTMAYECLPGLVFVQVPNERARWILTDQCVVEVNCPACGSLAGEPCNNDHWGRGVAKLKYASSTHCDRRDAFRRKKGWGHKDKPKLKVSLAALQEAQAVIGIDDEELSG